MKIILNGAAKELPSSLTVAKLLESIGVKKEEVVVERNLAIVQKADFEFTQLADDDRIEVVRFVGGG